MDNELVAQLSLELIRGIGAKGVRQLISYCGTASNVYHTSKSKLLKVPGVGLKMVEAIRASNNFAEAESIIQASARKGIQIIHFSNSDYPQRLKQVPDAPNIIFTKGLGNLNPTRSVAVVGSRKATTYGKKITEGIVQDLSFLDVTIISGLAYGIDIQAHKTALNLGMPTFAVIAGGIDRLYPSAHKKYALEMFENGGLVSESYPGIKPDPHLFPARNRIIAGMADVTIVVEADEKGGALITANIADSYNRTVFAVPGNIGNNFSKGTNRLIASQRALIYTGASDLVYHMGWDIVADSKTTDLPVNLEPDEQRVIEVIRMNESDVTIDQISIQAQIPLNKLASVLLELELKNLIKGLPGSKYRIN